MLLLVFILQTERVILLHQLQLLLLGSSMYLSQPLMEHFQSHRILFEKKGSFRKELGYILLNGESSMAQTILYNQLSVQMVYAVLNQVRVFALKEFLLGIRRLISIFKLNLVIPRHKELDKRYDQTQLFDLFRLASVLYNRGVYKHLIILRVIIHFISDASQLALLVNEEDAIQAFYLVGGDVLHAIMCGCKLHLVDF